jgi:curli biogenesis system outer membrane secretion channel CsgG
MKFYLIFIALLMVEVASAAKTRLSVTEFEDKSGSGRCHAHWYYNIGSGMQDQLISELSKIGRYSIQERATLKKMYEGEHQLINSKKKSLPKKNQFEAAQYTIVAAITGFELCGSGTGAGVGLSGESLGLPGFIRIGGKSEKAKVVVDLRIISVESGEVLKSFAVEGTASAVGFKVGADVKGVEFGGEGFDNTPIGEATRKAIQAAVETIQKTI